MGMRDFDLKGFVLHKGEKVGLIVAGGLMVVLIGLGIARAALSGSPNATASELNSLSKTTKNKMDTSDPTGTDPVVDPAQLAAVLTFERIDPSRFPLEFPFILPGSQDDMKRRSPEVLAPADFHTMVVKGAYLGHNLTTSRDGRIRVQILVDKQFGNSQNRSMTSGFGRMLGGIGGRGGASGLGGMTPPGMGDGGGDADMPGGGMPGMGMGGMGMGGMGEGGLGGMGMPGGMGMGGMGMGDLGSRRQFKDQWVDSKELEQKMDAKLAETLYPVRMVVVSASFPYKEQWEEFRRKLRRRTLGEMIMMHSAGETPFQFTGYQIQRRVYGPNGKLLKDWTDFTEDMEKAIKWHFIRASNFEQEDDKLLLYQDFGVLNERLVIPRPLLAKQQKYPKAELKELDEALAELDKLAKNTTPPPLSDRQRKLTGDFDIFNPLSSWQNQQMMMGEGAMDPMGQGMAGMGARGGMMPGGMMPSGPGGMMAGGPGTRMAGGPGGMMAGGPGGMMPGGMMPGGPGGMMPGAFRQGGGRMGGDVDGAGGTGQYDPNQFYNQEPVLAEKCLVRFIDPTVLPGHSYEYRIRIKMANPNYQQREEVLASKSFAKEKDIVAKEWTPVPGRIMVPSDLTYYVVDEKPEKGPLPTPGNQDRMVLQIHRWLDTVVTSATATGIRIPVGDWSILERVLLHRGEYIAQTKEMKVPTWETTIEDYILARNTSTRKNQVPVDFNSRFSLATPPALLVDFQQGGQVYVPVGSKKIYDEFQWQALILTPDGRLILRGSREDTENQERQDRLKEYRDWVKQVESAKRINSGQFNNTLDRLNPGLPGGGPGGRGPGGS